MAAMNSSLVTHEQQNLHLPPPVPTRNRSSSLKPYTSKQDSVRRKSAVDTFSTTIKRPELLTEHNIHQETNTPPPKRTASTWIQRRFTVFSFEQQSVSSIQSRRMTTGRFSFLSDTPDSNVYKQKRPKFLTHMVESFARRFSLGKKKSNEDSEPDETVVDPVYETLKVAAETRKLAVANYLQQRQQTLNKQTSLNSQGSSEPDTQSSPRNSRHASRTETEIVSSLRATPPVTPRQRTPPTDNARVTNC